MDKMIYLGANGATRALEQQQAIANNMANVSTTAFREQMSLARAVPFKGEPWQQQRVSSVATTQANRHAPGSIEQTGNPMDIAINGQGWLAVMDENQTQGYTRAGDLRINAQNELVNGQGWRVLGDDDQPIVVDGPGQISFSPTGQVNFLGAGDEPQAIAQVAQLKLVNPDIAQMQRQENGLFYVLNDQGQAQVAPIDEQVRLIDSALEKSNVSAAKSMVQMIEAARYFEMQMRVIQDANNNAQKANSILSMAQ